MNIDFKVEQREHVSRLKAKLSARVVQSAAGGFLLMHAMGPNVAGVVGSAIVAGLLLAFLK